MNNNNTKTEFVCCLCNETTNNRDDLIEIEGKLYCNECAEENFCTCVHCNHAVVNEDTIECDFDGEVYCTECYDELFHECADCSNIIPADEIHCQECLDNREYDDDEEEKDKLKEQIWAE